MGRKTDFIVEVEVQVEAEISGNRMGGDVDQSERAHAGELELETGLRTGK